MPTDATHRCKIFYCDRRRGSYCCSLCSARSTCHNRKGPCKNAPERCGLLREATPKEAAAAAGIRFITQATAKIIIETREPRGLYICREHGKFVGIDNRTGDAWTEEFTGKLACIDWLAGTMPREEAGA